jgi:hypothetical protein
VPNQYVIGQVILLKDVITDPATSTTLDDSTDAVTVYQPDGTSTVLATNHSGAAGSGQYSAAFTPTQVGWHEYVFKSTGAGAGAGRGRFFVSPVP